MQNSPYINDTVGKIQEAKQRKEENQKKYDEEMTLTIQGLASTEHGEEFLKKLVKYIGLFNSRKNFEDKEMIVSRAQEMVYLNLVRPYLTKGQRKVIEND